MVRFPDEFHGLSAQAGQTEDRAPEPLRPFGLINI
jgi:hypothetical protein